MAPTNEELEAKRAELIQELKDSSALNCVILAHSYQDAEWGKIVKESVSEILKKPHLKNVYDEFISDHDSLISALSYRLAKLLSNDLLNSSQLEPLFQSFFANDRDTGAEIIDDLSAARVRYVPNQSYVETLLYSQSFLALQAHKFAHDLWSDSFEVLALFIQQRVSEVFAVNILPEEKIESLMLLNKATGPFDGETGTGKNVTIYHGKVCVCQNKTLAKESPNHPANLVRKRLNVKDGYFHQEFYRDEEATAFRCQPHGAEIYQDGSIQLVQADNGSASSTQLASPPLNYKTSAPPGNIRDGNGEPLHYISDGASSLQARPSDGRYQLNNKFLSTGGEPIQPADRGSTNSTPLAWPSRIAVCAANNTGSASASSGNIEDGTRQAQHHTNGRAASSLVRPTNGRKKDKLSSLATIFIPIAFALLVASSAIWYSAGSTSLSARCHGVIVRSWAGPCRDSSGPSHRARILLILAEVFGFNGLLLCLGGYSRPSGSPSAQWLTVVGCVTILCGYISIMCTQLL